MKGRCEFFTNGTIYQRRPGIVDLTPVAAVRRAAKAMADAKKRNNRNNLPAHPELEQIASSGVEMADVIALRGYVGSKPGDEVVKLYPALEDMSISVEIPADEILATKEAPAATMPLGGVIVWVSRTADVKFRRTRTVSTTAQEVRKFFGARKAIDPTAPPTPPGRLNRLNLQLPPFTTPNPGVPPVYVPPENCNPCTSCNIVCQSKCEFQSTCS